MWTPKFPDRTSTEIQLTTLEECKTMSAAAHAKAKYDVEQAEGTPAVIPMPTPNAARLLAEPSEPARTQEMIDHEKQIIQRPRRLDRDMMAFAAVGVSPGVKSLQVQNGGLAELGTFTYFSVRRGWATAVDGRSSVVTVVYCGYKARLENGRVVLGGERGNVCAYDLRFRPFEGASNGGKILNSKKRTTIRLGLILDEATERVTKGVAQAEPALTLPRFWAAFRSDQLPEIEDCRAARRAALEAVRPGYEGPVLPSLRSPGGIVAEVFRDPETKEVWVAFVPEGTQPDEHGDYSADSAVTLPRTAVLRPYVQKGVRVPAGNPLADFVPRRMYPNVAKIAGLYGKDIADWLVQEAVAASDETIHGLHCRPVEMCPGQLDKAVTIFEDVRHLTDAEGFVRPQVVSVRNTLSALRVSRDDVVFADYSAVRPEWTHKFQPVRRSQQA